MRRFRDVRSCQTVRAAVERVCVGWGVARVLVGSGCRRCILCRAGIFYNLQCGGSRCSVDMRSDVLSMRWECDGTVLRQVEKRCLKHEMGVRWDSVKAG